MPYTRLTTDLRQTLRDIQSDPSQLFIVTDTNVERLVLPPLTEAMPELASTPRIVIPAGEAHKTLESMTGVWQALVEGGATRRAVILNVGGGMVTDMGGFAAATFKRGIRYINLPTTLLGAVDAATGGKTGIDFCGLKNEIGAFAMPEATHISTAPFATLPWEELLSGYGEMLKTALIADAGLYGKLRHGAPLLEDLPALEAPVLRCVEIKRDITDRDPHEKGLRKALNFGHTAGHAIESLLLERGTPAPHGIAVAWGIKMELILSHIELGLDSSVVTGYSALLRDTFPAIPLTCRDTDPLMALMGHDKKNAQAGQPDFTLLRAVASPQTGCTPSPSAISEALELLLNL